MILFSRFVFAAGLLLSVSLLSGCHSFRTDPDFPSDPLVSGKQTPSPETNQVARFQVGDTITVTLTDLPDEIPAHVEPIKEDGTITLPAIGHVVAAGKTAGELQNAIHDLYVPKYYTHVTVAVTIGDRVYYVKGEVKAPGRQLYLGETTVTMAITSAGDFTDFANHKNVWLIHGKKRTKVNCDEIFKHPEKDPVIYPGDEIDVRRKIF